MSRAEPDRQDRLLAPRSPAVTYQVYGLSIRSDFPFANYLMPGDGGGDIAFRCVPTPPLSPNWQQVRPLYSSVSAWDDGQRRLTVYRLDDCHVMRFSRVADYYLWPDRIVCQPADPPDLALVEGHFLSSVLSFFLEQHGIPMLHASAIVIDGAAVALASHSGSGKSTLAATFMQAGYPLLTDDIVPVDVSDHLFMARPGYPTLRMWPDEADYFLGDHEPFARVHPSATKRRVPVGTGGLGRFADRPYPLAALYLPHRLSESEDRGEIEIEAVAPRDAIIELVRASFTPRLVEAVGLQSARLRTFARVAHRVPIYSLTYPSGLQHLPRVRDTIVAHLHSLVPGTA